MDRQPNYQGNRGGNPGYRNDQRGRSFEGETPENKFASMPYDSSWIKNGASEEMVKYAEIAGQYLAKNGLTNSKIRSIYGEIKRIQMGEFEKEKSSFFLLKPKVAYALGRDANNKGLKLFKLIFDRCSADVSNQQTYLNFCNFIEAILAYHKAFGGKD